MKKIYLDKEISKKFISVAMTGIMLMTSVGCNKKNNDSTSNIKINVASISSTLGFKNLNSNKKTDNLYEESLLVKTTNQNIKKLFTDMNDDVISNTSLVLLLDILAKEDENGKISSDIISNFKSKIDSKNIMTDFNTFLTALENTMIKDKKIAITSTLLPDELKDEKLILSSIESITNNIINSSDKKQIVSEFDKIYTLFVEEDEIEIDGLKFEVRDLNYANRALAQSYARTAAYYAKDYITNEKYEKIDRRTNDQNNKAYIMVKLEILNNQIDEKSEIDVIKEFNEQYKSFSEFINEKVKLSLGDEKDLINYINLRYLVSDKVSTKDKKEILGGYEDSKISDTITAIDAICAYNYNNQEKGILFSDLLIDDYKTTEYGKIDTLAMNFIQFNTIMLLNEIKGNESFSEIFNNPYFQNIYNYILKREVTYMYKENGEVKESKIVYQEVSDNVNLICNEIIYNTLNKLPKVNYMDDYIKQSQSNVTESIQYIQNVITGECEKVDFEDFVNTVEEENIGDKTKVK